MLPAAATLAFAAQKLIFGVRARLQLLRPAERRFAGENVNVNWLSIVGRLLDWNVFLICIHAVSTAREILIRPERCIRLCWCVILK